MADDRGHCVRDQYHTTADDMTSSCACTESSRRPCHELSQRSGSSATSQCCATVSSEADQLIVYVHSSRIWKPKQVVCTHRDCGLAVVHCGRQSASIAFVDYFISHWLVTCAHISFEVHIAVAESMHKYIVAVRASHHKINKPSTIPCVLYTDHLHLGHVYVISAGSSPVHGI